MAYPPASPHRSPRTRWCRNISRLSITYACRPRLRDRLTLGRLTLPRKPQAYGDGVSHPVYRYSCQHKHLPVLQRSFRCAFAGYGNAPLPREDNLRTRSFGTKLEPRYIFGADPLDQ
jgi:hypothetical protein